MFKSLYKIVLHVSVTSNSCLKINNKSKYKNKLL